MSLSAKVGSCLFLRYFFIFFYKWELIAAGLRALFCPCRLFWSIILFSKPALYFGLITSVYSSVFEEFSAVFLFVDLVMGPIIWSRLHHITSVEEFCGATLKWSCCYNVSLRRGKIGTYSECRWITSRVKSREGKERTFINDFVMNWFLTGTFKT